MGLRPMMPVNGASGGHVDDWVGSESPERLYDTQRWDFGASRHS